MPYVFVALMIVFAGAYVYLRRSAALPSRLFFKAAASIMFVLLAVSLRVGATEPYYTFILIGLIFAFAGDILLIFTFHTRIYLISGMAAFSCAYIFYIIAFWTIAVPTWYEALFFVLTLILSVCALNLRQPKTDTQSPAIYFYAAILCAMAARAFSMLFAGASTAFSICAAVGGVFLALSDVLPAFQRLESRFGRAAEAVSIAAYYCGQALIAITVAL